MEVINNHAYANMNIIDSNMSNSNINTSKIDINNSIQNTYNEITNTNIHVSNSEDNILSSEDVMYFIQCSQLRNDLNNHKIIGDDDSELSDITDL